jgi:hypothetical protein
MTRCAVTTVDIDGEASKDLVAQWLLRITNSPKGREYRVTWRDATVVDPEVNYPKSADEVFLSLRDLMARDLTVPIEQGGSR